jgi:hypothetical protein
MTNSCHDDRNMIQLVAACHPSPIPVVAEHRVSLDNNRERSLYDVKSLVILAAPEWPQCAIAFHIDDKDTPSVRDRIGTLLPNSTRTWSLPVKRTLMPGLGESIDTVIDFATSPSGPLHGQPVPRKRRSCTCSVEIAQR